MKTAIVITVRMKSTRLPKKALLEIKGRTIIEHIIDRMKLSKNADMIVLATSTHSDDAVLADIAKKNGIYYFRGSEKDKLKRYLDASKEFDFDCMVDVSADNIFADPELADKTFASFKQDDVDVVKCIGFPLGVGSPGFSIAAVEKVCQMKEEEDTEAYGPYLFDSKIFKVVTIEAENSLHRPDIRLTIDYAEDFELAKRVFEELDSDKNNFSLDEIIRVFNKKPELLLINKVAQQKYEENFKNLAKPKVKKQYSQYFKFTDG